MIIIINTIQKRKINLTSIPTFLHQGTPCEFTTLSASPTCLLALTSRFPRAIIDDPPLFPPFVVVVVVVFLLLSFIAIVKPAMRSLLLVSADLPLPNSLITCRGCCCCPCCPPVRANPWDDEEGTDSVVVVLDMFVFLHTIVHNRQQIPYTPNFKDRGSQVPFIPHDRSLSLQRLRTTTQPIQMQIHIRSITLHTNQLQIPSKIPRIQPRDG